MEYHKKGINDLDLPKRIMKFVVDNCEKNKSGQGVISISCNKLWNMTNEDFEKLFGVKIKE